MSLANIFKFDLDLSKGGIQLGKLVIKTEDLYNTFISMVGQLIIIVLIALFMYVTIKVGNRIIDRFVERQDKLKFSLDKKKSKTIGAVLKSILKYAVYFFGIIAILTKLFGTISLTFASIGGVAIGFGAQNIIKDILNGFFILFEDQYAVGDFIEVEGKSGVVESIELRITRMRDFNGDVHIIPNGSVNKVTNHSRGDMRVLVDVIVSYDEDIDKVTSVLTKASEKFYKENDKMVEEPKVVGVTAFSDKGLNIRIVGKAKAMTQWEMENKLRKYIKEALDRENIEIPYNTIHVYNSGKREEKNG